jgi:hypothetical protein
MEMFSCNREKIEIGSVLTFTPSQPDGEPLDFPGGAPSAYIEFSDNSRAPAKVEYVEGNWLLHIINGLTWRLELTGEPIFQDKMRHRQFTVVEPIYQEDS